MRRYLRNLAVILLGTFVLLYPTTVFAGTLDDLVDAPADGGYVEGSQEPSDSGSRSAISDYMRDFTPVTEQNMQAANKMTSGIVSFLGTVSGVIVLIVGAGIFCVTALDLAYIGLPFTRGLLNPGYASGGAQGSPMGGGMMGGGMMGRGMGMGMPGGAQGGAVQEQGLRRKWISDEADYCVRTYCQPQGQQQGMPGGAMGMGMGMGMGGGMMSGAGQAQQPMPMKSVILEYLKKRAFFLVIFSVATIVLMSSIFTDCGINLAELIFKIMDKANAQIGSANF